MKGYIIGKLEPKDNLPFNLLLLADETVEAIERYIYTSEVYVVKENGHLQPIAVFVLSKASDVQMEIKNIAILESLQGKGIGSYLINEIKRIAIANKCENIIVGTPDCSLRQIRFYEKNGFTKYDIRKDFFIKNYSKPIIEDGVRLKDMLILKIEV